MATYMPASTRIGGRDFRWGERTYIMGIINVTPDSFSGDGLGGDVESALQQARRFMAEGADILDVGGESTRPDAEELSSEEELRRVIPAIERIALEIPLPISIDTYKSEVAGKALDAGASLLNDVWALKKDPGLANLAANRGVPILLMANQRGKQHHRIMQVISADLNRAIALAVRAGVPRENILIDPGIGFGKTLEQNLEIIRRLRELRSLGQPILLGTSRKSMIGMVLDVPPHQRLEGTAATVAIGIANGADLVRVHDVAAMAHVCKMADAIVRVNRKSHNAKP
ncbi:MAG: dihydropteroate synthase [Dehalococcoidia bacterium]|nr:dihydropteroate synthase [Dehalococcoidia bacterium]